MHWTGETAASGRIDALVAGVVDPVSGQPASKSTAVALRPFAAGWFGYAISTRAMRPDCAYWALAALPGGQQAELAGTEPPADWRGFARDLFGLEGEPLLVQDRARGVTRLAFVQDGRLSAALFVAPTPVALARSHVATLLAGADAAAALAGQPGADSPDQGATVCACFGVGANTIIRAVQERGWRRSMPWAPRCAPAAIAARAGPRSGR